jgi:hypothetical protein
MVYYYRRMDATTSLDGLQVALCAPSQSALIRDVSLSEKLYLSRGVQVLDVVWVNGAADLISLETLRQWSASCGWNVVQLDRLGAGSLSE